MDVLSSLGLDSLPEQQTRVSGGSALPSVASALASDPNVRLGFDACCNCGTSLLSSAKKAEKNGKKAKKVVRCKRCRRVSYCSERCRSEDADPPLRRRDGGDGDEDDDAAMGHSAVVCSLLRLCDVDERADEGEGGEGEYDEAAEDRVRSEYESYPATLGRVLVEVPCYGDGRGMIKDRNRVGASKEGKSSSLTVHVVGASEGAELWSDRRRTDEGGGGASSADDSYEAYAEALADLAETEDLSTVNLIFVGPECPKKDFRVVRTISTTSESDDDDEGERGGKKRKRPKQQKKKPKRRRLVVETHRRGYDANGRALPEADVVVFFNPGFTCTDYEWDGALGRVKAGTPFLVTTNTEMEGVADCQYLLERGFIAALPPEVAYVVGRNGSSGAGGDEDMFFGWNPYCGSRVRQSGTMANDLFVKNRWMFGGRWGGSSSSSLPAPADPTKHTTADADANEGDGGGPKEDGRSKKRSKKGGGKSKRKNRALM